MLLRRLLSSFRLAVLWPLIITSLVSAVLLWTLLPRVLEESATVHLSDTLPVLAPLVTERLADQQGEDLQAWVEGLGASSELRVTVIAGDGRVLADSASGWDEVGRMDNHRERPEVLAALVDREGSSIRQSDTTGLDYVYVARREVGPDGSLVVIRLAQPLRELAALRHSVLRVMVLTGLVALFTAALVLWGLRRHLLQPLDELVDGANRMALGEAPGGLEIPQAEELATMATALNQLSARVDEQIEQARGERNHLRTIISSMTDGILVTDSEGRVRFTNETFRALLGVVADPDPDSVLEFTRRPEIASLVSLCLQEARSVSLEKTISEGGRILGISAVPIASEGALLVVRDVTDRTHLDATRRDFVANVSHEIKTPLTAIRGYAETLDEGALEDAEMAPRFIQRILGQCARLEALLADLLPLARLEAAEEQDFEMERVELIPLVEAAIEVIRPSAEKRGIEIVTELSPAMPSFVGDAGALEVLVQNLLANAVKYNREGGSIRVGLEIQEGEILLTVADTGIGIPEDSISRVFERFYRVDKGRARAEGGTGLGLALVKHATRLHAGRVEVKSRLGVGSTFLVVLPLGGHGEAVEPVVVEPRPS